ncbi:MAG TPA: argininosuccinate synthase, partial [Terriglobia bacterium]|nr:argininosuccinate synthase [Terriglobia bacterium]
EALDAFFEKTNEAVTGSVTMSLYKGNLTVKSRNSPKSLYRADNGPAGPENNNRPDTQELNKFLGLSSVVRIRR